MRTQPTESMQPSDDLEAQVRDLASSIGLNPGSVEMLLQDHAQQLPVLIKVLGCFIGGFTWSKAFSVRHSDPKLADDLVYKIATNAGLQLPQKPFADSKSV